MLRILSQVIILQIALSFKVSWICSVEVGKETRNNKRVRNLARSDIFNELFRILVKMRPLYKLRHVSW